MPDKLFRDADDLDTLLQPLAPAGTPGKSTLTSRMSSGRPSQVIFRVESAEAAQVFADRFGPRDDNGVATGAEEHIDRASTSTGSPLPGDLRERFETSLGTDLSDVRLHTDEASAQAAAAVGAKAFATGNDVHFGAGAYDPSSEAGAFLIAHEVAHTVQQRGAAPAPQYKLEVSTPGDTAEVEADRAAESMVVGAPTSLSRGGSLAIARETQMPEAKISPSKPLTADDRNRLANAQQLMDKATKNADTAIKALQAYSSGAPSKLAAIQSSYETFITQYETQYERVNSVIEKAKNIAKIQEEVLVGIAGAALGGVASGLVALGGTIGGTIETVQSAYAGLSEWMGPMASATGLPGQAKGMAGMGTGEKSGPSLDSPLSQKLQFWQDYSKLQGQSTKLVGLATNAATLNRGIGKVQATIDGINDTEKTRSDYPISKLETDAARLENGTRSLGAAAPSVDGLLDKLSSTASMMAAMKPKNDVELQKELWVRWAAGISRTDTDLLDLDVIEDHLKKLGIWSQLGLDHGDWFSDEEEAIAVCSAKAQEKVLQCKGEAVSVTLAGGSVVGKVSIGSLPPLAASISGAPPDATSGSAVVMSARTVRQVTTDVLKKTTPNKNAVAEYLLNNGYIEVSLRYFEDATKKEPEAAPADQGPMPDGTEAPSDSGG